MNDMPDFNFPFYLLFILFEAFLCTKGIFLRLIFARVIFLGLFMSGLFFRPFYVRVFSARPLKSTPQNLILTHERNLINKLLNVIRFNLDFLKNYPCQVS